MYFFFPEFLEFIPYVWILHADHPPIQAST